MNKEVELKEIIDLCKTKKGESLFKDLKTIIKVKPYLSIVDKMGILFLFSNEIDMLGNTISPISLQIDIEMMKVYILLFSYTNVNTNNYPKTYLNTENYDLLCESGCVDYIYKICGKDYKKLMEIYKESVNFRNIFAVKEYIDDIDINKLQNISENFKSEIDSIDEKDKDRIVDILKYQNPSMKKIVDEFQKEVMKENLKENNAEEPKK